MKICGRWLWASSLHKSCTRFSILAAFLIIGFPGAKASAPPPQPTLHWQPWSDSAFAQARAQHKFVLLDLEAVWCHWCHVMDEITYRDPVVIRLLNERYILVKVDQDSRPDISNRYQDYKLNRAALFLCTAQACSSPVFRPEDVRGTILRAQIPRR